MSVFLRDSRDPSPSLTRRHLLRGVAAASLAAGAGALLAGCGAGASDGKGSTADAAGKDGLEEITFLNILPLASLSYAPELLADTGGHFADQGLKVKFETTKGSAPALQTIIAGKALITRVGDIETMQAAGAKKAPVVNIGVVTHRGPIRMVSSRRAPIEKPEDFRGKLIGLPSEGGTSETTLDLVVRSAGIDPKSVRRQVVGLAPGVFDLVKAGRIDAYIVSLDTASALKQQQPDAVIFDPGTAIASGSQLYLTSQAALQDERQAALLRRYLLAIKAAVEAVKADTGLDKTLNLIGSKYDVPVLKTPEVAKESLRGYLESWYAAGPENLVRTVDTSWEKTYGELVAAGLVNGGLNPKDWRSDKVAPGAV